MGNLLAARFYLVIARDDIDAACADINEWDRRSRLGTDRRKPRTQYEKPVVHSRPSPISEGTGISFTLHPWSRCVHDFNVSRRNKTICG